MTETKLTHQAITCGDPEKIIGGGGGPRDNFVFLGGGGGKAYAYFLEINYVNLIN